MKRCFPPVRHYNGNMENPFLMWSSFVIVVLVLMLLDLGILHRKERAIGVRESLWMSGFYILISCLFGVWVWWRLGPDSGSDFFTGYVVEKTLSMDNIFIMSLLFGFFRIPQQQQHRVLFWGILGVIFLRGLLIGVGSAIIAHFYWVMYLFAAFLIFTGVKMLFTREEDEPDLAQNKLLQWLRRSFRITPQLHGKRFFVRLPDPARNNKKALWLTPLLVALVAIECADIIFALDSVPAIFGITTDPYIVYTSNIFAILGLRALYFALAAVIHRFTHLRYSLALILAFIGGKVFVTHLFGMEEFPAWISLSVTLALIAGGIGYSLLAAKEKTAV
jgi:tellurite resistance protein TerC